MKSLIKLFGIGALLLCNGCNSGDENHYVIPRAYQSNESLQIEFPWSPARLDTQAGFDLQMTISESELKDFGLNPDDFIPMGGIVYNRRYQNNQTSNLNNKRNK